MFGASVSLTTSPNNLFHSALFTKKACKPLFNVIPPIYLFFFKERLSLLEFFLILDAILFYIYIYILNLQLTVVIIRL